MESKKQRAREERKTLNKAQEFHYASAFRAADRALAQARNSKS